MFLNVLLTLLLLIPGRALMAADPGAPAGESRKSVPATAQSQLTSATLGEVSPPVFSDGFEEPPPCEADPAAPSALSADVISSSRVDLEWTDNSISTPCAADSFGIYRDDVEIDRTVGPETSYSDLTVSSGTDYAYLVRAFHGDRVSTDSNTVFVTVGGSLNINVSGTNHLGNAVNQSLPPNVTATISGISGSVCLGGSGVVCTDSSGVSGATCNETTDECLCPAQCGNANYGALMRGSCIHVTNGQSFNSGSGTVQFFVNGDCNPANNSGSFSLTVSF